MEAPLRKSMLCLALLSGGTTPAARRTQAAKVPTMTKAGETVFLSNASIKVGVDLGHGGAITFLAAIGDGRNVINDHDLGREIQQSYYSGPHPFGKPIFKGFGWNPITAGDYAHHPSIVAAHHMLGATLYVRTVPMQWAVNNKPCECTFESWLTLDGDQIKVRQRLTNHRIDPTQYPAEANEVPAIYTNGFLRRIVTYLGDRPFTGGAVAEPAPAWPPHRFAATENWVAIVDRNGRGLGVINPATTLFDAGFSGRQQDGGEHDDQTGYVSPRMVDVLDHDIVYDTAYTLVLGSVDEIRHVAQAMRPADPRPLYRFRGNRQGWSYVNAHDGGWPIAGRLNVSEGADPQLIGPARAFPAASVSALYVTAAFKGLSTPAQLFWSTTAEPGFSERRSVKVAASVDGAMHTIRIPTAGVPGWSGTITGLRFDPPGDGGSTANICAIAWQPTGC